MTRGGKREGAGRPKGKPTFTIRLPESVRLAAEALQRIGRGEGTQTDIAELMMAANVSGKSGFQGIVGADEVSRAIRDLLSKERDLRHAGKWDEYEATQARRESLEARYEVVRLG